MKTTIIMPVYNTELYLSEAIESILNQKLEDLELIIINDGSTDSSVQIIEDYVKKDERIKVFHQENQGPSVARNLGISRAMGEFIYFMDSDDVLEPDALEVCYERCKAENLDFAFFDASSFYEVTRGFGDYSRGLLLGYSSQPGRDFLEFQLRTSTFKVPVWLNFINREFLRNEKIWFLPDVLHEDEAFTFELYLKAKRMCYIPRQFFKRRIRVDSIMTKPFGWKNIEGYITTAETLLRDYPGELLVEKYLSNMLPVAIQKAYQLGIKERLFILTWCLMKYKKYIPWKSFLILLGKKYIKGA